MTTTQEMAEGRTRVGGKQRFGRIMAMMSLGLLVAITSACVQVQAPDRPIEIVLTINIRQEIVYRLDGDAKSAIEQNAEIF